MLRSIRRLLAAVTTAVLVSTAFAGESDDRPLQIVDANGKVVGRSIGPSAYIEIDGDVYEVPMKPHLNGLHFGWRYSNGPLAFDSTDCTGTPYLQAEPTTVMPSIEIKPAKLYLTHHLAHSDLTGHHFNSTMSVDGRCVVGDYALIRMAWKLEPKPVLLNKMFTEPMLVK